MKYWKRFWGGLNQGWKRINYLIIFAAPVLLFGLAALVQSDALAVYSLAHPVVYMLIVIITFWVKEGFRSNNGTEKDD